jgi:hypothetical protein
MSTLRVNTIQDSTGSSSPAINGLAKAWVNFNGTGTVAIRASLNVSSITDNATGDYTVNFTTALADANYSFACAGSQNESPSYTGMSIGSGATSSSAFRVTFRLYSNSQVDPLQAGITVFR